VVLELCAACEQELVAHQMNCVLDEPSVDVIGFNIRQYVDTCARNEAIRTPVETKAVTYLMAVCDCEPMQEIEVDCVAGLPEERIDADRAIKVALDVHFRTAVECMLPSPDNVTP